MSACEKCWRDANWRAMHFGGSVVDHYHDLLKERKDRPCSEAEQRGDDQRALEADDPTEAAQDGGRP